MRSRETSSTITSWPDTAPRPKADSRGSSEHLELEVWGWDDVGVGLRLRRDGPPMVRREHRQPLDDPGKFLSQSAVAALGTRFPLRDQHGKTKDGRDHRRLRRLGGCQARPSDYLPAASYAAAISALIRPRSLTS